MDGKPLYGKRRKKNNAQKVGLLFFVGCVCYIGVIRAEGQKEGVGGGGHRDLTIMYTFDHKLFFQRSDGRTKLNSEKVLYWIMKF